MSIGHLLSVLYCFSSAGPVYLFPPFRVRPSGSSSFIAVKSQRQWEKKHRLMSVCVCVCVEDGGGCKIQKAGEGRSEKVSWCLTEKVVLHRDLNKQNIDSLVKSELLNI